MKRFTLRMYAFAVAVLTAFLGATSVSAAAYPTLAELYGRYTFNGTMTSMAEEQGEAAVEPAARTGYTMVIVPGAEENTVQMLGFCGYGGGLTATYNAETGILNCSQNAFFVSGSLNYSTGEGVQAVADAGVDIDNDYAPLYFDLNFQVSEQEGRIVIAADDELSITAMTYGAGLEMDVWTYAVGYTLTKESANVSVESIAGTYKFIGNAPVDASYSDAWEEFDLILAPKANGKVGMKGLFDFDDEIEVDYFADGGILLLPVDFTFSNGAFMGNYEGTDENYGYDIVTRPEAAPYILVENGKLTTPSTFTVNGKYNDEQGYTPSFSFCGGEGSKVGGAGVAGTVAENSNLSIMPLQGGIRVQAAEATQIEVYDVRAVKVAGTVATSADFNGLAAGIYIVKAGGRTAKVIVR